VAARVPATCQGCGSKAQGGPRTPDPAYTALCGWPQQRYCCCCVVGLLVQRRGVVLLVARCLLGELVGAGRWATAARCLVSSSLLGGPGRSGGGPGQGAVYIGRGRQIVMGWQGQGYQLLPLHEPSSCSNCRGRVCLFGCRCLCAQSQLVLASCTHR
jgi:hypothetical protein